MKSLLVFLSLLSFDFASAETKISVNEAKLQFSKMCNNNVECQKDVFSIPENATCQELRAFMLKHGVRVTTGQDVSEVVDCK